MLASPIAQTIFPANLHFSMTMQLACPKKIQTNIVQQNKVITTTNSTAPDLEHYLQSGSLLAIQTVQKNCKTVQKHLKFEINATTPVI